MFPYMLLIAAGFETFVSTEHVLQHHPNRLIPFILCSSNAEAFLQIMRVFFLENVNKSCASYYPS